MDGKRGERLFVSVSDWGSVALCSHRLTQIQLLIKQLDTVLCVEVCAHCMCVCG